MHSVSPMKEWAYCTLVGFLLFFAGTLMSPYSLPLMLIYSFPPLLLAYWRGPYAAAASASFAALCLIFLLPPLFSVIYLMTFALSGILSGTLARKVENKADLLLAGTVISLCCKLLTALLISRLTGSSFLAPDTADVEQTLSLFADMQIPGFPASGDAAAGDQISAIVSYMVLLIPYSMILFSAIEAFCGFSLASYLHRKRTGESFFSLPPFGAWRFPKNVFVALLVGFVCERLALRNPDAYMLRQVGANLNALTRTLFIIQGLSVAYYFMSIRGISKFLKVLVILLTPLISFLGDICAIVGIIDIGFDLRKKKGGNRQ